MNPLFFDDTRFYRETVVDIDAAIVGVSRTRWEALETAQATPERSADLMRRNHFDVLPIVDGWAVHEYFCTAVWGDYSQVGRQRIGRQDIIPHQPHVRDVIRGLATEERRFYFLSYEHHIVGLLSVADLNCRQVKIYLGSLLSELEIRLGAFITKQVPDEADLRKLTLDSGKEKYTDIKARFDADRANGLDAPLVEYLYLADLLTISAQPVLFTELGFAS
jgi:hypothetical protein